MFSDVKILERFKIYVILIVVVVVVTVVAVVAGQTFRPISSNQLGKLGNNNNTYI